MITTETWIANVDDPAAFMGDQRAVAILLYAAGLTDKAAVMDCKAQCLRRSLRHFFVIAMVQFAAPATELNVAEHALTGCVAGNQRASVAGPEIFGWDIPECDAGAQTRTDRAVQRCVRAEAEYHITTWEQKTASYDVDRWVERKDRGQHASWFDAGKFKQSVDLFGRYNTTLTNQVVKLLHELERLRRMRQGEGVPPPMVADVSVDLQMPAVADVGDASPLAPPMAADLTFTAGETEQPPAGAHGGAEEGGIPRVAQAPSPVETPESRSSQPGGRATC